MAIQHQSPAIIVGPSLLYQQPTIIEYNTMKTSV
jgi:hypothetical protein